MHRYEMSFKTPNTLKWEAIVGVIGTCGIAWFYLHDLAWTWSIFSSEKFLILFGIAVVIGLCRGLARLGSPPNRAPLRDRRDWHSVWK